MANVGQTVIIRTALFEFFRGSECIIIEDMIHEQATKKD